MKMISINKFLAAMQLIEGYTQAFDDDIYDLTEFYENKQRIIDLLNDEDDKELIGNGSGHSGITFRRAVDRYFLEGIKQFKDISKEQYKKSYDHVSS